ncbi:hypothetical protein EVAR_52495_1 [Eumeta japonica]|uniref:Uncharacterized protein n=1 Tax=Eumeta variegata TaxID=151549 RepID=A0A4C1ZI48_EUMVA|nr:hypothetical protein EVAR_52495_1 [Eumeta japonica]
MDPNCTLPVGKGRPRKSYAGHIGGVFKKGQILSTPNRRACMKRLTDVSERKEICKDRTVWKSSLCLPVWEIRPRQQADIATLQKYLL